MFKELSFDMIPLVKSYHYYAYPLGILKGNSFSNYECCLLNNFRTLFFAGNMQFYVDDYEYWDVFSVENINDIDTNNIIAEIKKAIRNNKYIHISGIDEYYIPSRYANHKYHFHHDILIVGYDADEVITVGYNDKGLYNKENINISLLEKSFSEITIFKTIKVKDIKLDLNYENILVSLDEYFASKEILNIFRTENVILDYESWIYGINAMETLFAKMRRMEKDYFFHNLLLCIECKQLILYKLEKTKVFFKNPQIVDDYKEILERYEIIRAKIFKKLVKGRNYIEEIELMEHVYYKEKQFADSWRTEKESMSSSV